MSDIPQQVVQYLSASAPFDVFDEDTLHGIANVYNRLCDPAEL